MLRGLRIENIGLLETLELSFERGLTVLTGETGAGKSILLDALDAVFGGYQGVSATRLLRVGSSSAQIEATFSANPLIQAWFSKEGIELEDEDLTISREWRVKKDRLISRSRINGTLINRHQLAILKPLLIDFTVQGQTYELISSSNQLFWLDRFGDLALKDALEQVKNNWRIWTESCQLLEKAKVESKNLLAKSQEIKEILETLETADLNDPFEDQKLEIEQDRLVNGVKLQEGLISLFTYFKGRTDDMPSIIDQLGICFHELQSMSKLDTSLLIYLEKTSDILKNIEELVIDLDRYSDLLENESFRLDEIQGRLALLKKLQRNYGFGLPDLIKYRDDLRELESTHDYSTLLNELENKENHARNERDHANFNLRKIRNSLAQKLEKKLLDFLRPLGLLNVSFKVQLNESTPTMQGIDSVQFLFSANPGQPLAPLGEVASGGEMSRFLLALKTVLSEVDGSSTLVFDEIDSGVSGRVSSAIGKVLKDLASHRQVFCVTHQPLIAAVADHHFRVVKFVENEITQSCVVKLSDFQDRQKELAELVGGDFEEARQYAAKLLDQKAA